MNPLQSLLPPTSLPSFRAVRLKQSDVLWRNPSLRPAHPLDHYALCNAVEGELDRIGANQPGNFTLLAERYGGEGLGRNGGGARCGLWRDVQIKGVGQNLLASAGEFFHSYGGASLAEGLLDAIWGDVCHAVLPYGGVRVFALLGTGSKVRLRYPRTGGPTHTPRVLTLRQGALRPAHFMRAVFFAPASAAAAIGAGEPALCSDTVRTTRAALALPGALRRLGLMAPRGVAGASGAAPASMPVADADAANTADALHEVARRAAGQLARARARRLMHGSLTPSNIALDGRWLDFTSISAVSDYGRVIIPRGAPDFMHEERLLLPSLLDFAFYAFKYSPAVRQAFPTAQHLAASMQSAFNTHLARQLPEEFVRLLGFTQAEVADCPAQMRDATYSAMMAIARAGNRAPFTILRGDNDFNPSMPARMGSHHLPTILTVLACACDGAWADAALAAHLSDARLRQDLIAAWLPMRQSLEAHDDLDSQGRRRLWRAFEALRLNAPHDALYRTTLYPAIEALLGDGRAQAPAVQRFVDDAVVYGADWLADASAGAGNGKSAKSTKSTKSTKTGTLPTLRFRGMGSAVCVEFRMHEGLSIQGTHLPREAVFKTLQDVAQAPPEFITATQEAHAQEFPSRL